MVNESTALTNAAVLGTNEFGRAYEEGFYRTVRVLCSRGADLDVANDCAQAAWTRARERRADLRDAGLLLPWVNSIAINEWRNWIRDVRAPRGGGIEPSYTPALVAQQVVRELLDTSADENVLYLEYFHIWVFSISQIAARRHVSPIAVRVRLCRARLRLKRRCTQDRNRRGS